MNGFDIPGLAIGIVVDDKLVYAKGFGVRSKSDGRPVDTRTIFQIGSNTKAFLAATEAIMVDRGKLRWDDRVVDLYPEFQLKDPWVTREFRVFDLLAQRSGLPPLVNDMLAMLDFDDAALIGSLRHVEPVSSFRTTFAYTNITHLLAGRIVARAAGAPDWTAVLQQELLDPLGMKDSTYTAEAIEAAANHASGHRWTPEGTIEVPFTPIFPYHLGGSGNINSNVEDMARWVRMQLGNGTFEGRRIVSPENLAVTRTPKVALNDQLSYDLGWYTLLTPNGGIVWHDGDTRSFGSFVGLLPDRTFGVIILTNEHSRGVRYRSEFGSWTGFLATPNATMWRTISITRRPFSRRQPRSGQTRQSATVPDRLHRSSATSPIRASARRRLGRTGIARHGDSGDRRQAQARAGTAISSSREFTPDRPFSGRWSTSTI